MGFVSEDGIPYGSIDVSQLDEIDPKTDEAKAEQEKAQSVQGQKEAQKETTTKADQGDKGSQSHGSKKE